MTQTLTPKHECVGGWIPVVQIFDAVFHYSDHGGTEEKKHKIVDRWELREERNPDSEGAWDINAETQMAHYAVKPCKTCKPGWLPPDKRPVEEVVSDEEARRMGHKARAASREADDAEVWGPPRPYRDD